MFTTYSGNVTASTSSGVVTNSVALSATGYKPVAILDSSLPMGNVQVGASTTGIVYLSNSGRGKVTYSPPTSASVTGAGFSFVSTTCTGTTLNSDQDCSTTVRFTPTSAGSSAGTLTVVTQAGNLTSTLTGTGVQSQLSFSPTALNWGTQQINASYVSGTVTLTNTGNEPAANVSLSVPAGFALSSSTCGSSLAAGDSCTFSIVWTPTSATNYSGNVTASASNGIASNSLALSGIGATAQLNFNPTVVNWGSQQVNGTYGSGTVTLTNSGGITATGISLATSSSFSVVGSNCGSSLGAGASCTFAVNWSPTAAQSYTGAVTLTSNNAGTSSLALSGTGLQSQLRFSPVSLDWGSQPINSSYVSSAVTLSNYGNETATGVSVGVSGSGFSLSNNGCGSSLASGSQCTFTVTWSPTVTQPYSGQVTTTNSNGTVQNSIPLSGTGTAVATTTTVTSSASSLTFSTTKDNTSATQSITVRNTGTLSATLSWPLAYTGGTVQMGLFATAGGTCDSIGTLAPGGSCTISVNYTANCTVGTRTATMNIQGSNFVTLPVTLRGTTSGGQC